MIQLTKTQDFVRFSGKVILVHTLTYMIFGGLAMTIFDYPALWKLPHLADSFKPMDSQWVQLGALFQPLRAILYSAVLWFLRPLYLEKKRGWLYIWLIFLAFAIFGTSGTPSGSFEGIIYLNWPLWLHLIFLPEVVLQTLAFSYFLYRWDLSASSHSDNSSQSLEPGLKRFIYSLAYMAIGTFGTMASGIITLLLVGYSIEPGGTSASALVVLALVAVVNFAMAIYIYSGTWKSRRQFIILSVAIYLLNSLPYAIHNYIIDFKVGAFYTMLGGIFTATFLILFASKKSGQSLSK